LKKALTSKSIIYFFKATGIWQLDKSAINGKITPLEVFVHEEREASVRIEEVED
jgi:hypothetical protein